MNRYKFGSCTWPKVEDYICIISLSTSKVLCALPPFVRICFKSGEYYQSVLDLQHNFASKYYLVKMTIMYYLKNHYNCLRNLDSRGSRVMIGHTNKQIFMIYLYKYIYTFLTLIWSKLYRTHAVWTTLLLLNDPSQYSDTSLGNARTSRLVACGM